MSRSPAIVLFDSNGIEMAVQDGAVVAGPQRGLLFAGRDPANNARFARMAADGTIRIDPTGTTTQPVVVLDEITTGSISSNGGLLEQEHNGVGNSAVQITGSWVGTLQFEATVNGVDWFPVVAYGTGPSALANTGTTVNYVGRIVCAGTRAVRVRASAWTSGTANITIRGGAVAGVVRANVTQNAYTSIANSSTSPLSGNATFTGTLENCISTMGIQVSVFASEDSAPDGLRIEQSQDGTNWDIVDRYTVLANEGLSRTIQSVATFVRVVYTNGPSAQSAFRLQTVLVPMVEALPRATGHGGGVFIEPVEHPTFTVQATDVDLGNGKSLLSLALAAGSPRIVRLREVFLRNSRTASTTGVPVTFGLYRFATHSAGTLLAPNSRDTGDLLTGAVTARSAASIASEGAEEMRWEWSSDEWGTGTLDQEGLDHAFQTTFPLLVKRDAYTKPPTIRAGQGYHLKCVTNTTNGTFDVIFVFTVEV